MYKMADLPEEARIKDRLLTTMWSRAVDLGVPEEQIAAAAASEDAGALLALIHSATRPARVAEAADRAGLGEAWKARLEEAVRNQVRFEAEAQAAAVRDQVRIEEEAAAAAAGRLVLDRDNADAEARHQRARDNADAARADRVAMYAPESVAAQRNLAGAILVLILVTALGVGLKTQYGGGGGGSSAKKKRSKRRRVRKT